MQQNQTIRRNALTAAASLALLGGAASGLAIFAVPATAAHAQVPFRVSRPENGATVRETARFQIPRRALPSDAKYLSLTIDNHFRGGIFIPQVTDPKKPVRTDVVQANDSTIYLLWDTKALDPTPNLSDEERIVKDGPHTVVISVHDANGKRIATQSITVNVNNRGTLPSPAGGVLLAYSFKLGQERHYQQHTEVSYISERPAVADNGGTGGGNSGYSSRGAGQGGGTPGGFGGGFPGGGGPEDGGGRGPGFGGAGYPGGGPGGYPGGPGGGYPGTTGASGPVDLPVQVVTANFERTVEDALGGGQYFIRDKVQDGVIVGGNGSAERLENVYEFKSRYRTVFNSGFIKDYGVASSTHPGAYIALPLINLGGVRRRVGQNWSSKSPVLLEWATLDKPPMVTVQNTLETLEWQDNRQTARIKQTYAGKASIPIFGGAGIMKDADVKMERTIWFGFKTGDVIRMETTTEVSGNAPANILSSMVPQAGIAAPGGIGGGGFSGGPEDGGGFGIPGGPGGGGLFGGRGGGMAPGGGLAGGPGAGFGAEQQQPTAPAKFRSKTTVSLTQTAAKPVLATR